MQLLLGNNLDYLKEMPSESVDLVAIDPPYNSGQDYYDKNGRFSDRFGNPKELAEETEIVSVAHSGLHDFILSLPPDSARWYTLFMSARIVHLHRVLKETGSIFLQCDDSANSYNRIVLDFVFGKSNRRNEIVWDRSTGKQSDSTRKFGRVSDHILFYAKSDRSTFHPQYLPYEKEYLAKFDRDSHDGRGKWKQSSITKNADRPRLEYEFMGQTHKWTLSKTKMQSMYEQGRLWQDPKTGKVWKKLYLSEARGVPVNSHWGDIPAVWSKSEESVSYPTQKPIALYRRIIECATNPGDLVLDCFGGSGTTAIAAIRSGRDFVMMERNQADIDIIRKRLEHEANAEDGMALEAHPTQAARNEVEVVNQSDLFAHTPPGFALSPEAGNAPATLSHEDKQAILKAQGGVCAGCAKQFLSYQDDHIVPKQYGGGNDIRNRQLLCYDCHLFKTQWERKNKCPINLQWFREQRRGG